MAPSIKTLSQDEPRIGDQAATQPLSGIDVVTVTRVKGNNNMGFTRTEQPNKKAG